MRRILLVALASVSMVASVSLFATQNTGAIGIPTGDFSIEVSPSPLFATVQPGTSTVLDLKIRNASIQPEELKIEARSFSLIGDKQTIHLSDSTPPELAEWISYSAPTFMVDPGEWFQQKITVALPEEAGFSHSFALVISRVNESATDPTNGRLLKGSVAIFTLINIDKPGATRKLEIESLTTSQPVYEYLPATIQLRLKNSGNSIVQPYGNFYLQRGTNDKNPLAVLSVNDSNGYILPGATKDITTKWSDGFPVYKTSENGSFVDWSLSQARDFRLGKYTAKVVAVYNDGSRDIPLVGEVTFWVLPWKILLGGIIAAALLIVGIWTIMRQIGQKFRHLRTPKRP